MKVYNISGKEVRSYMLYKYNDSFTINTWGLENGTYLLKVVENDKIIPAMKMVIMR